MDLSGLNERQREAVQELKRNVLLLAPAGTGKTDTLARRIAYIIEMKAAKPEEILCLTFTNKACREMAARIAKYCGASGLRVNIRTFHGFCYDVIKSEAKRHSDFFTDFTIVDEVDAQGILRDLTEDKWPLKAIWPLVAQLKEARTLSLEGDYEAALQGVLTHSPEKVKRLTLDERFSFDADLFDYWQREGAALTAAYDERLHDMHGLDFNDLIRGARELLMRSAVSAKWARRFSFIHVDEMQDTSELEYDIVNRIFGTSRVLLAGDYFQTIYEWRGSKPEAVLERFQKSHTPRRISLVKNYRATKTLLDASFMALQSFFPARVAAIYPEGLRAESELIGEPIELKGAFDTPEEAHWIYCRIQQLPLVDYSRVCILARTNRYTRELSSSFRSLGKYQPPEEQLPFMLIEEMKFFRRQEIKDVLAFLRLTLNKHDMTSLVRILGRFGRGIGPRTIKAIGAQEVRCTGLRLTDFLNEEARRDKDPYSALLAGLSAGNVVVFDVEATGLDVTRDEIIQIAGVRLGADGKVTEKFYKTLRPTKSVGESRWVHGLTDAMLKEQGEDAAQTLKEFSDFARGAVLVGHNVTYDLSILRSHLARLGLEPLEYPCYYDTLEIFRRFYPTLPNHKLDTLSKHFQTENRPSHDALADILATADILGYAVKNNIVPTTEARRAYFLKWEGLFEELAELIFAFRREAPLVRPPKLLGEIVLRAGIKDYYARRGEEHRVENMRELFRKATDLDDKAITPPDSLARFLHYASLSSTDLEALSKKPQIPILTVHQAKGCEFDYVFLAGLQERIFPLQSAEEEGHLTEEERLFYVAITRAKKQLFLSWAQQRQFGRYAHMSRFIHAIPRRYLKNV